MSTRKKRKNLFVVCAILFFTGLASASAGKGKATMLSRVQTIDDPELGELIRVALENLPETKRLRQMNPHGKDYEQAKADEATARLRTVRLVTETYMHIKLLDSQIDQSEAKLASSNLPEALARELVLAKAELEYKRATKLAELREIMNIIPRHALGRKPVKDLKGWLRLDVLGDSVLVFTGDKPFTNEDHPYRHVFVGLMSRDGATEYAQHFVLKRDHRPVRVDIERSTAGIKFSEELQKEIIHTVRSAKLELDAEVHLSKDVPRGARDNFLFLVKGRIGEYISQISGRYQGKRTITKELRRLVDPDDFDRYFRAVLVGAPGRLPVKFNIEFDEESKDLASRTVKAIEDTAKKLGVEKFVETAQKQADFDDVK